MSYRFFLWGMIILVIVSFLLILTTLICLSPYSEAYSFQQTVPVNILIFEISVFLALFAGFSLILFRLRTLKLTNLRAKELNLLAGVSLRQGFLLALASLILLIMQSLEVLIWWDGLLVIGAVIMVELYFLAR